MYCKPNEISEEAYEAEEVGQVIPPEVGLCQDSRNKPQYHGNDGEGDEN